MKHEYFSSNLASKTLYAIAGKDSLSLVNFRVQRLMEKLMTGCGFSNLTTSNPCGAEQLSQLVPMKCLKHCIGFGRGHL